MARLNGETCYEYLTGDDWGCVSTNETRIINQINRLKTKYPDDVAIQRSPEDNDGVLVAKIPRTWIKKPSPPRRSRELTPEEFEVMRKRIATARNTKVETPTSDEDDEDE